MLLLRLKQYLMQKCTANIQELTQHLQIDTNALRPMLSCWIRKGKVKKLEQLPACGATCHKCDPEDLEIYQWLE